MRWGVENQHFTRNLLSHFVDKNAINVWFLRRPDIHKLDRGNNGNVREPKRSYWFVMIRIMWIIIWKWRPNWRQQCKATISARPHLSQFLLLILYPVIHLVSCPLPCATKCMADVRTGKPSAESISHFNSSHHNYNDLKLPPRTRSKLMSNGM